MSNSSYKEFYKDIDRKQIYSTADAPEQHPSYRDLKQFIEEFDLTSKKLLEIGALKGAFQNIIQNYKGLDISESLAKYYHKPFFTVNNDGSYPFNGNIFDAIWAIDVHEHIPDINQALFELKRVLKPGGVVYFAPAWQCRPWASEGYAVRPFSDFTIKGKLIKALIPLRDSVLWRSFYLFPKRLFRHLSYLFGEKNYKLKYNKT